MASKAMLKIISDDSRNERVSTRHRVLLSAKIITTTDELAVKLRNVSATGALVEGAKLPAVGSDVIIQRGSFEAFGTVRWVDGNKAGVEFEEPLSEDELWTQVAPATPAGPEPVVIDRWRPGLKSQPLSAEERAIMQEWAQPQGRRAYLD